MQHAASDKAITPVRTGRSEPGGPTKTDNCKEHLTERGLDAARRELNGEVVATKSTGKPWDHVDEVRMPKMAGQPYWLAQTPAWRFSGLGFRPCAVRG